MTNPDKHYSLQAPEYGSVRERIISDAEKTRNAVRFERLVQVGAAALLRDPEAFYRERSHARAEMKRRRAHPEARIVERLGLRGIRLAHEMMRYGEHVFTKANLTIEFPDEDPCKETAQDTEEREEAIITLKEQCVTLDTALHHPQDFADPPEADVIADIELFGKTYLNQLYESFSPRLKFLVKRLRAAPTAEDQHDAIVAIHNMIARRANDKTKAHEFDDLKDESGNAYYHPLRLSLDLLGGFPDSAAKPTCLGVSAIMAACYEAAGLDYMHAGTMIDRFMAARMQQVEAMEMVQQYAEVQGVELPDKLRETLAGAIEAVREKVLKDDGYHALVVARLKDGSWLMSDPYMGVDYRLKYERDFISLIYRDVKAQQRRGLPIEITTRNDDTFSYWGEQLLGTLLEYEQDIQPQQTVDEWDAFLAQCPLSTAPSDIIAQQTDFIRMPQYELFFTYEVPGMLDEPVGHDEWYFDRSRQVLLDYIFPEAAESGDLQACLARCQRDPAYRRRRAEDLRWLPVMTVVRTTSEILNCMIKGEVWMQHASLELGAPHHRIGAAVLSNLSLAVQAANPDAAWWISHWSSQEALGHVLASEGLGRRARQLVQHNVTVTSKSKQLTHVKKSDIMDAFSRESAASVTENV